MTRLSIRGVSVDSGVREFASRLEGGKLVRQSTDPCLAGPDFSAESPGRAYNRDRAKRLQSRQLRLQVTEFVRPFPQEFRAGCFVILGQLFVGRPALKRQEARIPHGESTVHRRDCRTRGHRTYARRSSAGGGRTAAAPRNADARHVSGPNDEAGCT